MIVIGLFISSLAWFVKKEITSFGSRLDKHQDILFNMSQSLAIALGKIDILDRMVNGGGGRRTTDKSK